MKKGLLFGLLLAGLLAGPASAETLKVYSAIEGKYIMTEKVVKTEKEWKNILSPEQFRILREKGTERAYSGKYHDHKGDGVYRCAGCGLDLFTSKTKYDSGTGWPSFTAPVAPENVRTEADRSFFTTRTEVLCARCGGHIGHVFDDGPKPTGKRFCMNSAALEFVENK